MTKKGKAKSEPCPYFDFEPGMNEDGSMCEEPVCNNPSIMYEIGGIENCPHLKDDSVKCLLKTNFLESEEG